MASSTQRPGDPEPLDGLATREFALIADAAPVPMWTTGPDGARRFVNQAYVEFLNVDRAAALAFDWRDILHPDDAVRVRAETEAGVAAGATFTVEARYRRHDGSWRWMRSVSRPRQAGEGARGGYVGIAHDITDAKVAELALRARERQLSVLIEQTTAGLAQLDLESRFLMVNDRFCEIVGRSRAELLTLTSLAITHPDDLVRNTGQLGGLVATGNPFSTDKRYVRPDGTIAWVSNSAAVTRDDEGRPHSIIAVTLDITARREAEALLQFLDALTRATAAATDADAVLATTTRMLGEHLGAAACLCADVEADEDHFHVRGEWRASAGAAATPGRRIADLGAAAAASLRAGEPWTTPADGDAATLCLPFLRGGRLAGLMAVSAAAPRRWTPAELSLVREVSERSWAHVERVRAEAALRDHERQLRLAIDGARIGTWEQDLRTGRARWSNRTADIMGVGHGETLSDADRLARIHPDDRERIARGTLDLAREGSDFATEHRVIRPDGSLRWVAMHGVVMRDEAGRVIRTLGTVRDVTERRQALEALTALNQTLEAQIADRTAERDRMWRLSRDLFVVVDRRRRVSAVNPAIAGLGYAPEEVVGRALGSFVHPDDRAAANAAIRRAAYQPISEFQARLRDAAGGWRLYAWSAAPGDGEAYVIGRDVTAETQRREELELAQDSLRQAQKVESLGELTGGVAHDFNNLLTPIIGNLDLLARRLQRDGGGDERQARMIRAALESAERARVLVQRLLAFARRQPLQPGPVDLDALLASLDSLVGSTVGAQVEVRTAIADDVPPALADQNQLELALLNLAVNARDAMPGGGALDLAAVLATPAELARAGLAGSFVALTVTDSGAGMDADTRARAIEPFFSTKGVGKGTGLGLSMVHGLALQLGGAMLLDSAPGEGTRVTLLLPVAAAPPARRAIAVETASAAGAGRVLLVDDEAAVREATAAMLEGLGYEVETAASAEEALARLDGQAFLVTDHLMPGMKGADLCRAAQAARPDLRMLVVSGYAGLDEIPPDLARLPKPFRLDDLARAMDGLGEPAA